MKSRRDRKGKLSRSEKVLVIVTSVTGLSVVIFSVVMIWLVNLI
jgi:cell division protein FtsL